MNRIDLAIKGELLLSALSDDELDGAIRSLNAAYRAGAPRVSNEAYDSIWIPALRERQPDHPFLHAPEPESVPESKRVKHKTPMLSTDKAYSVEEVAKWQARVRQAALAVGKDPATVQIRFTAKLDGIAATDDGQRLVKRGDGQYGEDVSVAFERGVIPVGGRGKGPGELVIVDQFFREHIEEPFDIDHPRGFMAGLCGADSIKAHHKGALEAGVCRFVPFSKLPEVMVPLDSLLEWLDDSRETALSVPYRTDGVVIDVVDEDIRTKLGATSHHPRWNLALKTAGETASATIKDVTLQVGRTGRITPVMEIEPVRLSNATLTRATAHTGRNLARKGLGPGAVIEVIRSGEVIPTLVAVVQASDKAVDVDHCPECGADTEFDGEYLVCPNHEDCPAQGQRLLLHFFQTIRVADGFGPVTISKLFRNGIRSISQIYSLTAADFEQMGVGAKDSENLEAELARSRRERLDEAHFLAAFGIRHLGRGDSRKILSAHDLREVGRLTAADIEAIYGFGEITSPLIADSLHEMWPEIESVLDLGFNLEPVPQEQLDGPLAGKKIVVTGTLSRPREDIQAVIREHGGEPVGSVSSNTDFLLAGEKTGAAKLSKARQHNVEIIGEDRFMELIGEVA